NNVERSRLSSRLLHGSERPSRPRDASDRELRALPRSRSCGRYCAALYNTVRPHSSIGNLPPAHYAKLSAPASQRDGTLRAIRGSAPRPVAAPSQAGEIDGHGQHAYVLKWRQWKVLVWGCSCRFKIDCAEYAVERPPLSYLKQLHPNEFAAFDARFFSSR